MFKTVSPYDLKGNVFDMIGRQWMLVTAGSGETCNTMTASWGGLGVLWGSPAATCYIRPQRYTKEFLDREEYFTLSFFDESFRSALNLCGSKSGRDVDKVAACGFTLEHAACGAPYFAEASLVLVCRRRFSQELDCSRIPEDVKQTWYPQQDWHTMYIGEILEVLQKI